MTIEEAFGIVIRRLRKELFLSQEELSKISSLDRGFISRLEGGKQQPTLVTIFELAVALNVPAPRILTEVEQLLHFNKSNIARHDLKQMECEKFWKRFGGKIVSNDRDVSGLETILLVEDELHLRQFLSDTLTEKGYTVITAEDGQDAVDKYKENMDCIDLVLMDIMMPRKDGVTAHKEMTALHADVKILLMSGYSTVSLGDIDNINFIQKPMLPAKLFTHIRNLLDCTVKRTKPEIAGR